MKNFHKVTEGIDISVLLERILSSPSFWEVDTTRQDFPGSPHHDTQVIHVRQQEVRSLEAIFNDLDALDTSVAYNLFHNLQPLTKQALAALGEYGDLGRVMITKLPPGGRIDPHPDEGSYAEHYDRFHLCLQAGPETHFRCGQETVQMAPGELWWFNHKLEHEVVNRSAIDRIHLIIDAQVPAYRSRRGVYYQQETGLDIWNEMVPLLKKHWQEIAKYKDIALNPDRDAYEAMLQSGSLRCYTARDGGVLIGYAVYFVRRNPHYKDSLQAVQDVLFMDPSHRKGLMAGLRLIRMSEQRLKLEGVQVIYQHTKRVNRLGEILRHEGYDLSDEVWAKRLD